MGVLMSYGCGRSCVRLHDAFALIHFPAMALDDS